METITQLILRKYFQPGANAWDINCGWCEEWALEAQRQFGGEVLWLDQVQEYHDRYYQEYCHEDGWDPPHAHAVLFLNNRYYDSQSPEGVLSVFELGLVRGVSRAQYMENIR